MIIVDKNNSGETKSDQNDKPSKIHSEQVKLRQCNNPEIIEAKIAISELIPKLSHAIQQHGPDYEQLVHIYDQMAQLYYKIYDFHNSIEFTKHAMRIQQSKMGFHHESIIPMLARQGRASLHLYRYTDAKIYYEEEYEVRQKHNQQPQEFVKSKLNISEALTNLGRFDEAIVSTKYV